MNGWILDEWMNGWMDGWMDRWMDGWMDDWMDELVQLSNDIFLLKRVSRYGRCFMIDSGSKECPEQESARCHFGTLGRNFFRGKNKMAAKYFKVKYDFSTNEARNKCNNSFSCDFDWAIHFLYYFDDSRSSSRSKRQFQGQFLTNKDRNMCNTSFTWDFI